MLKKNSELLCNVCQFHGRFLEIGKLDLSNNNTLGMSVLLKNVTFHGILLDSLSDPDSAEKRQVVQLVADGIKS